MKYGYIRVSTKEQNLDRQTAALKEYAPELKDEFIFSDKQSGKNFERAEYQKLKSVLVGGDELIVKELDRLGRNKDAVKNELKEFKEIGVIVRILELPTTLMDFKGQEWANEMINNILIEVIGTIAEQERNKILRRQQEGVSAMRIVNGKRISSKTGRSVGRPEKELTDFEKISKKQKDGLTTVTDACRELGISRTQWYRKTKKQNNPPSSKSTDCPVDTTQQSADTEIVSRSLQKSKENNND